MPTRAGWLTIVVSVGVVVLGRFFGLIELYVIGAVGPALVLVAVGHVRLAELRLRVRRIVTPSRVHAGDATRIELAATNIGRARTPALRLQDPVAGTRGATLDLAPLGRNEAARAAYRLPTTNRGVVAVGPLVLELLDPFGLARRSVVAAPRLDLTVLPHVDNVVLPNASGDRDVHSGVVRRNELGRQGEDFYGLREYVVGDDMRRVHWPSSARSSELMIRQDETPHQDRTTVVLDTRIASITPDAFEAAVSAAASCVTAAYRSSHLVRLLASDGTDSNSGAGLAHVDALLEYLAVVDRSGTGSLRLVLDQLARTPSGGLLVVVLGRPTGFELEALVRLCPRFTGVVAVATQGPVPPVRAKGLTIVDLSLGAPLTEQWAATQRRANRSVPA